MPRNLAVSVYVSLDGVVEDPVGMEGSGLGDLTGPFSRGPDGDDIMHQELWAADIVLMGRTTYQGFIAVWPTINDPVGFAKKLNAMPKCVASNTMERADWDHTTVLSGDVTGEVHKLKNGDGGDILVMATLASSIRFCRTD